MEHLHRLRGDVREISDQQPQPTATPVYAREAHSRPPVTFAEAEAHNPYALLTDLHDHALTIDTLGRRPANADHHLAELALSAAVVAWWSRWQPISMHRAFLAGADLSDVAKAMGTTEADAYRRWAEWADAQVNLIIAGRPGVDPAEVAALRERLDPEISSG